MVSAKFFDCFDERLLRSSKFPGSSYGQIMDDRRRFAAAPADRMERTSPSKDLSRHWGEHALWVGNIAPEATVMTLRDYFSEAAPHRVLSIAYNPDAKYAFVNFASEAGRSAAISHAAANMFAGRRLDCRIRQGTMARSTKVHYGSGFSGRAAFTISSDQGNTLEQQAQELLHFPEVLQGEWGKDKFFILKSFSMAALSRSIETGKWYIPKRHCTRLNVAFKTARKVYFLFSVNGSGTFSGIALMKSTTRPDKETTIQPNDIHRTNSTRSDSSLPRFLVSSAKQTETGLRIPTLASTNYAPGMICYEPERRRIVWEASHDPDEDSENESTDSSVLSPHGTTMHDSWTSFDSIDAFPRDMSSTSPARPSVTFQNPSIRALWDFDAHQEPSSQSLLMEKLEQFGCPCQIEWLSTESIPFDDIRGIKNAWNKNKEIHVARNVTAIEPRAASSLLRFWRIRTDAG